jgi:hypothetical protein
LPHGDGHPIFAIHDTRALAAVCFSVPWRASAGDLRATVRRSRSGRSFAFRLADSSGAIHTERELKQTAAAVLFFVTPDCPISQGYVPEMNRIAEAYRSRGIAFFAVQPTSRHPTPRSAAM